MKIIEFILKLIFIAIMTLFGVVMAIIAPEEHRWGYYSFSLFCFLMVIICIAKGGLWEFAISGVASFIVILGVGYLIHEITEGVLFSGSMSKPSIINAIFFCAIFVYPALKAIFYLRFGFRKKEEHTEVENFTENEKSVKK